MSGAKRICYYTNESFFNRDQQGYFVAKVTENEAGYEETFGLSRTLAAAQAKADILNMKLGLSPNDVLDIVASSMRQGKVVSTG